MQTERFGDVSLNGRPQTVLGPVLKPGDEVAEVILNNKGFDGTRALLESTAGKVRLLNVVSSLGTSLCDAQTRRFNQEASVLGDVYGTDIKELRVKQRSVFVVDREGIVRHAEYVPEISQHPNYEAALSAVRSLPGRRMDDD
jgi:thioredoxin-dependent peroxiredoxin